MSKGKEKKEDNELPVIEIEKGLRKTEEFFKAYKKPLAYTVGGIALVVALYFGYSEFIYAPKVAEAEEQMYLSQNHFERDSFNLALNGNGTLEPGFKHIVEDFGSTPSGNLANFYAGVCCLKLGEYARAIDYFDDFKSNDEIFAARALSNIGACYAELGELDKAATYFEKAARKKVNPIASPQYLMKATAVYMKQQRYDKALKIYEEIKYKYPQSNEARTIDKYIERAKIAASK
ncbi:MAG: tetratricopeptide repeat protein [Prevotellaceae bacterium]|jgi:tetratricopeptide (TPR) repeat protein|nr:tetratricopeptide repeat protein [Prevotellaceae bacterium]